MSPQAPKVPIAAALNRSPPSRPAPLFVEQPLVGLMAAFGLAIADSIHSAMDTTATDVGPGELAIAILHLISLYLPLGLIAGVLGAFVGTIARHTPAWTGVRQRLAPRMWLVADPTGFSGALAALVGLGVLALAARGAYELIATRTHRADYAAWAMAGAMAGAALFALVVRAIVASVVRPIARRMGRFASVGLLGAVVLATGIAIAWYVIAHSPELEMAYGISTMIWPPLAALLYGVSFAIVRWRLRWRGVRAWLALVIAIAAALGAWAFGALVYGRDNRVRSVVEQRSVLGRQLVRRYAGLTDLDRDGHAWAFGGRDCNDFDARIHPGAADPAGDGVDSDCFAGDGSPDVADLAQGAYGARPSGFPTRPNFLVLTIDALRPDHLGAFGYRRPTSPNLDAFANGAVRFEYALSQSSRSIRSIPAMWTGRYPSQVAFGPEYLWPEVLPSNVTVAELLSQRGYRTEAVMGTDYFARINGFFQGFGYARQIPIYKPPRDMAVNEALERLEGLAAQPEPWLLWVHLFGVHAPYLTPPYPSRFGIEQVDGYDTEITLADEQAQRLFIALDRLGLRNNTVVIVASDHGEAFGEHGEWGHSTTVYDEELRSTLMIRAPGIHGRTVHDHVALFDIAPTILNMADIPVPAPTPARSLLPLLTQQSRAPPRRMIFSELMPDGMLPYDVKAVHRGDLALLWWVQEGTIQLFSLRDDPRERNDLSNDRRDTALELLGLTQAWVAQTNLPENRTDEFIARHRMRGPPASMTHPLDARLPGMLTILGYDFPRDRFHAGETIPLTFYYRADATMDEDLYFRVDIVGPDGYVVPPHFHANHYPLQARYHTNQWRAGEYLSDPNPIVIPREIQAPVRLHFRLMIQSGQEMLNMEQNGITTPVIDLAEFEILSSE